MGSRTLCLLSSTNNFWIYVPTWASLSITLRRSTSKMSSLSYWIRRYTVPTLASAKEALEELEGFVSVESLHCFWILLKDSTGFFLLMAKISSWLSEVLEEESWMMGFGFPPTTVGCFSSFVWNFSTLGLAGYSSTTSKPFSICGLSWDKLSWTKARVS